MRRSSTARRRSRPRRRPTGRPRPAPRRGRPASRRSPRPWTPPGRRRAPSTSANVDGVLGSLLDLVEIERGWEAAVEAALGEALASVVVADAGVARRALGHLHEARVHGGVLAPGTAPAGRPTRPAVGLTAGRPVRSLVRAGDARVATVLDDLLAGAVAVDGGWSEALDLALAHPDVTVVTREGDRFSPAGFRVGSGGAGATAAALDEARTTNAAVAVEVTTAGQRLVGLRHEREALAAGHGSLRARLDSLVADRTEAEQAADEARRRVRRPAERRSASPGPSASALVACRDPARGRGHRRAGARPSRRWRRTRPRRPAGGPSALRGQRPAGRTGPGAGRPPPGPGRADRRGRRAGRRAGAAAAGRREPSGRRQPGPGRRRSACRAHRALLRRCRAPRPSWSSVTAARSSCASPSCTSSGGGRLEEARAATLALEQLRVERADAERKLAEVGRAAAPLRDRATPRCARGWRPRSSTSGTSSTPSRRRPWRPSSRLCPRASRRRRGCGTWSVRSA